MLGTTCAGGHPSANPGARPSSLLGVILDASPTSIRNLTAPLCVNLGTQFPQGLPAIVYPTNIQDVKMQQLLPDLFLVALIVAYTAVAVYDIIKSVRTERKVRTPLVAVFCCLLMAIDLY